MDFYTKMFLANIVAMLFTSGMDRNIFDDALERMFFIGTTLKLWAFFSLCTVPVWLFYIILTA